MKKIIFTISIFLSLVTISCKKEKISNNVDAVKVVAQLTADETLKTAFINPSVNWLAGTDQIGVFSDRAYTTAPGNYAVNVPYTAQTTSPISVFTSEIPVYWDGSANAHNFYAYYPFSSEDTDLKAIPVSLPYIQAQIGKSTAQIGALDFEVATPLTLNPIPGNNPPADFSFNHLFTILKFNITCSSLSSNVLTSITLNKSANPPMSLPNGSSIDITQATPSAGVPYTFSVAGGGEPLTMILYTNLPISTSVSSAYLMILPHDSTGDTFSIDFLSSSGKHYVAYKSGINFERGKVYTITTDIPVGGANGW